MRFPFRHLQGSDQRLVIPYQSHICPSTYRILFSFTKAEVRGSPPCEVPKERAPDSDDLDIVTVDMVDMVWWNGRWPVLESESRCMPLLANNLTYFLPFPSLTISHRTPIPIPCVSPMLPFPLLSTLPFPHLQTAQASPPPL